jgi:hypothetical protein
MTDQAERELCNGKLEILFADESSMRCTVCDWSGWPRQDVDTKTGIVWRTYPHPYVKWQQPIQWLPGSR